MAAAAAGAGVAGGWEVDGLLWKRGELNTGWQARYFVLTRRVDLEYYAVDGAPYGASKGLVTVSLRPGCQGDAESTVVRAGGRDGNKALLQVALASHGGGAGPGRAPGSAAVVPAGAAAGDADA